MIPNLPNLIFLFSLCLGFLIQSSLCKTQPIDPSTSSNYKQITVEHYDLDWKINFEKTKIEGSVVISLKALKPTNQVIFDTRDLEFYKIQENGTNQELSYEIIENGIFGQKLRITTKNLEEGEKITLKIVYSSSQNAVAVQFLTAEQTTDGKAPYLFSQCQEINARSILPCMDTPSVKSSYTAKVSVPKGLTCLMSAVRTGNSTSENSDIFEYHQKVPIPTYLLAIVVGKLESRKISDRIDVWAEPSKVAAAQYEFAETEKLLRIAEDLAGPYIWGRYDLMILPESFPFGGMENPCLTFVTSQAVVGDRSMVNIIAHEIAHSWTGNLATMVSWEHFWLNEGFTTFLERKILGRMNGEKSRQFKMQLGFENDLTTEVKDMGELSEHTKLVQNLSGIDPHEALTSVPYEKGGALLFTLEQKLNDVPRFEQFLRNYIQEFSNTPVSSEDFKEFLYKSYADKKDVLDNVIDWDLWFNKPGLPPKPDYDTSLNDESLGIAKKWTEDEKIPKHTRSTFLKMTADQKNAVIDEIKRTYEKPNCQKYFNINKFRAITKIYHLDTNKSPLIKFSWLMLGLALNYEPIIQPSLDYVSQTGNIYYSSTIYKKLFGWAKSKDLAIQTFNQNVPKMNPLTVNAIRKIMPKTEL
ncbi:unnamed protein product [Caenorhabditis angaria]|uniref:Peptidase M1 leukotriene A4 hydrolase/aminopeptidase C-terminal domain-containing protein n=1 Tax=Caenorhabditis angaria TaxID=860376 RepID=A0A9P1IMB8_9PELO|nr:unnamed protein product [Caenorhabditis angaria]